VGSPLTVTVLAAIFSDLLAHFSSAEDAVVPAIEEKYTEIH